MNEIRKPGKPKGAKSTIPYNLGKLYEKFGANSCPPISMVWLRENGMLEKAGEIVNNNQVVAAPKTKQVQVSVIEFDKE